MTTLSAPPKSIPPTQDDIDEVERLRREQRRAIGEHLAASESLGAACGRITSRRASMRERTRTKPPVVGKT